MTTDRTPPITATEGARTEAVRDDVERHRFVVEQDGVVAELVYRTLPGRLVLVHTEVPDALAGRGIGGQLVTAATRRAVDEHRTVVPWCPFARAWLRDHPDVAATVDVDWSPPP
jgi:predicted GNAT family acetyltransferase